MVKSNTTRGKLAKKLGANVATRRRARKWSQEDLAERLGVAAETISRFERGATLPSLITLQRLSQMLKAPIAELLAESSQAPDDQAGVIAAWISPLREDEREYVLGIVKGACDHFRRKR
jgi:transcriptional regulator with XRE-family HTH domain